MNFSYSIEEVCAATSLGKTKIYQFIGTGQLKAHKVGKRTLILKTDLEVFLQGLPQLPVYARNSKSTVKE